MTQLSEHVIWITFGKIPVLLALSALVMVSARRLGWRVTLWSLVAFLTSLSIGVTLLPSILGAMAMSAFSALCVLSALTRDTSRSWRLLIWPLSLTFAVILIVGRIGCWLAGCCFGELTHGWWATQYTTEGFIAEYQLDRYHALAEGLPHPVHSVQLYESLSVMLLLGLALKVRKRWGEVSATFGLAGGYLALRGGLDPLRASVNTLSSLVEWGPLSQFQWVVFTLSIIALISALRSRDHLPSPAQEITLHQQSIFADDHPLALLLGWTLAVIATLLSLELGTPFTAQLSALGLCLATTPIALWMRHRINLHLRDRGELKRDLVLYPLGAAALLSPLLMLLPISSDLSARDGESLSQRTWVYSLDRKTGKVGRLGRIGTRPLYAQNTPFELEPETPVSEIDELNALDPSSRQRAQPPVTQSQKRDSPKPKGHPRLRVILGGGGGHLNDTSNGCGGEGVYRQESWQFYHAAMSYRHLDGEVKGSVVASALSTLSSYKGEQDLSGRHHQLSINAGYQLEGDWFKVGLAPRLSVRLLDDPSVDQRDFIGLDYLVALGYQTATWGSFVEVASGPLWSILPDLRHRLNYRFYYQSSPGNRLSLGLSLFGLSEVSGLLSPGLELGFEMNFWEVLIGVQDSGLKDGQLYGAQIGWRL